MIEKFVIGIAGSPFGVKGAVKVRSCSGETSHFLKLKSIIVSKEGKEQEYQIDEISVSAPPALLIKFNGIDSPEAAKTLSGARLITSREQAAPLEEGEFYIEDLKGLSVQSDKGEEIGHVANIIEGGGGELAEIKLINGEKRLIPFRKEFFKKILPAKGMIIMDNLWIFD